ncbi:heat shock protein SSB1 [Echinococcus multilocularis]|uniref:Heat shock protein SSB1 n=1 Tax=Echinococcus multilocularis TaxID=6211 RepID=A0A087VXA2_ECHMU|nr:heat shock protein SSB1 [Echinococcus multilocularis]
MFGRPHHLVGEPFAILRCNGVTMRSNDAFIAAILLLSLLSSCLCFSASASISSTSSDRRALCLVPWCYFVQHQILHQLRHVTAQFGCQHCCTVRHCLAWVDGPLYIPTIEVALQHPLHLQNMRRSTHQQYVMDVAPAQLLTTQRRLRIIYRLTEEVHAQHLQYSSCQHFLCRLTRLSQTVDSFLGSGQVLARVRLLDHLHIVIYQSRTDVPTTQMRITANRLHLKFVILYGEDGHVESATAPIEDEHIVLLFAFPVHTVCNGSCCRLIDETQHI